MQIKTFYRFSLIRKSDFEYLDVIINYFPELDHTTQNPSEWDFEKVSSWKFSADTKLSYIKCMDDDGEITYSNFEFKIFGIGIEIKKQNGY